MSDNDKIPIIEGIDINEGMGRLMHRWDMYERLLKGFYTDHLQFIQSFEIARHLGDKDRLKQMIHSFKGITGTISATRLYQGSIQIEVAYRNNDENIDLLWDEIKANLIKLMAELREKLNIDNRSPDNK